MSNSVSDQIAAALRRRIYEGSLQGGWALKQEDLAAEFGVSRIPVREALKKLETDGLVRHEMHKGAVVAMHSVAEIIEMLDIRIGLEVRALKLAIPRLTAGHFQQAEAILAKYDAADKPSVWSSLNLEFHLTLYRAADKPRLLKMIEDIVLGTQRYTRIYISHTVGRERPQQEHQAMLTALKRHDADLALNLLEAHISHTQTAILAAQDG